MVSGPGCWASPSWKPPSERIPRQAEPAEASGPSPSGPRVDPPRRSDADPAGSVGGFTPLAPTIEACSLMVRRRSRIVPTNQA
jgi:hypothetical protein